GDRADLLAARRGRGLVDARGLAQQHRRRRGLEDEAERAVLVDGDLDRDDRAPLALGLRVVRLAEVHDGHAVRAQRGADRRRGRALPGGDLDLDDGQHLLLGHGGSSRECVGPDGDGAGGWTRASDATDKSARRGRRPASPAPARRDQSLATCENSSSTGVSRPKMLTSTLSRSWSSLISMTSPEKSANGPSLTRTVSPSSYSSRGLARAAACSSPAFGMRKASTSRRGSGDGLAPWPTKPVTPGVLRMTVHALSSSSARTSR